MRTGTLEGWKRWMMMSEIERGKLIRECENARKKEGVNNDN